MATPLTPVTSSNLDSVGRIKTKRKDDLRVLFKSGGVYDYKGAGDVLNSILAADSKGKFLHFWVKGFYPYIKRSGGAASMSAARTPAPKKDRITGSRRNPRGSASTTRGGIEIDATTEKALRNKVDSLKGKRRVDIGTLKAVYRRGAGAFSGSHRPGMTRNQWSMGRVNAFLKLLKTGQRKKAYNTDLDLLPKDHPQSTRQAEDTVRPSASMRRAAKWALEARAAAPPSKRAGTPVGIARARDLAANRPLSVTTLKRIRDFINRSASTADAAPARDEQGHVPKSKQALGLWGARRGTEVAEWAARQIRRLEGDQ
jgi:hypothetical protein